MKKTILFRLGAKEFQWTSVLGMFLAIITILMLIKSAAVMFDSWQAIKGFDACIDSAANYSKDLSSNTGLDQLVFELKANDCKQSFYQITGAQVPGGKYVLTSRQMVTALVEPVAWFFIWAVLFLFSLSLVANKAIVIPVEEVEVAARPFRRK